MIDLPQFQVKLTARQQQILDLIQSAIARTGAPPTRAEIASELGFRSANAAEEHLQALARKGVIELVSGTSRGIRLRSEALRSINESRVKQYALPLPSLAQLALPLVGRGERVGVLNVYGTDQGAFDEHAVLVGGLVAAAVTAVLQDVEEKLALQTTTGNLEEALRGKSRA